MCLSKLWDMIHPYSIDISTFVIPIEDKKTLLFNYEEFCMVVRTKNIINCTPYDLKEEVVVVNRDY